MLLSFATNALLNLRDAKPTRVLRGFVGYVRATRTSLPRWKRTGRTGRLAPRAPRTVRTGCAYQPGALGTYRVPWQPRCDETSGAVCTGVRGAPGAPLKLLRRPRHTARWALEVVPPYYSQPRAPAAAGP